MSVEVMNEAPCTHISFVSKISIVFKIRKFHCKYHVLPPQGAEERVRRTEKTPFEDEFLGGSRRPTDSFDRWRPYEKKYKKKRKGTGRYAVESLSGEVAYLKADWTIGQRWFRSLTAVMRLHGEGWPDDGLRAKIDFTCERSLTVARRVGRSGERGTLAFAHAFGFRCNKGGEEPPTTSHTTLLHIYTVSVARSLARQIEASPLTLSPSFSLSLFSWKQMTERHGHRGSPDVPRPAGLHGITTPIILAWEESREPSGYHSRSLEFAFTLLGVEGREEAHRERTATMRS